MTIDDLTLCRHLVQEAGWNQVDADWMRAMKLDPTGCFVAEFDNQPVATTTSCRFGPIAWIAMVLVDVTVRGKGIGQQMVEHAIDHLVRQGTETIRLDATALGQALYKKLGFQDEYEVVRYWRNPVEQKAGSEDLHVISAGEPMNEKLINLDQEVTGTNRKCYIEDLINENGGPFYYKISKTGKVAGYAFSRTGSTATQIGPAIALSSTDGSLLLDAIASQYHGVKTYVDIPVENRSATAWAKSNGFEEQRRFMRMFRGQRIHDQPKLIWAISGPEKG